MKPLKITLVGNRNGTRKLRWVGVLAAACVFAAIASPIVAVYAMFIEALPVAAILMTVVSLATMLGTMIRIGFSTPLDELPILD